MAGESRQTPEDVLDDAVRRGAIVSVMYFDVSSNDKGTVQAALAELVAKINKEPGIIATAGEISEPIEFEGMWTSGAEVTLLAKSFAVLVAVAIHYGPIGVEVMRPDKIVLSLGEAQGVLLNISQIGQEFAQYALTQAMGESEKEEFKKQQAARIAMGKKLLEGAGAPGAQEENK
ncbi:MAG: hypothetical protein PHF51_02760 [Candidatus ainarchaeum sp.]|nr:hypothetical protein [Candidatus ainarchaeum sp.]